MPRTSPIELKHGVYAFIIENMVNSLNPSIVIIKILEKKRSFTNFL